ncbi:unnamed protein product [Phyllotreta striolata]|uniref:Regulator of microtubule dynamics protein 1 n=1 Tax=Phyllotreta striolata TaxID=444603 RepID=A0A9N9XLU2_PHYSR|nr:unnamed protein product [Phyllotreta striolata]
MRNVFTRLLTFRHFSMGDKFTSFKKNNTLIGAAFLGVISAAGMFLVEHYRQEKVRHRMAKDLARLDQELSQVRKELDQVLKKSSDRSLKGRRAKSSIKKANSAVSSSTLDEYLSSTNLDSSDLEFYDLSDNELEADKSSNLSGLLDTVDHKLDKDNAATLEEVLNMLTDLCLEHPQHPELLWRIGKAHKKLADHSQDKAVIREHVTKGIEACQSALQLKDDSPDVHKWYAILIGLRTEFVSIQEKINDGFLFKQHVEKALALSPADGVLHHMLGMFDYQIAGMRWYERKVAAALFSEPPSSTFEEALGHFLEAEKLTAYGWKTNRLMVAKCYVAKGEYKEAVEWLVKASRVSPKDESEHKEDVEINELLRKYDSYR